MEKAQEMLDSELAHLAEVNRSQVIYIYKYTKREYLLYYLLLIYYS